ncbi:Transcription initiation factor TFIID subunit 9 [Didymella heteroderae]|uniref:Transcription initiation factor TFIID subunit 9 n=1 Tax=Didymella heteroderae TaxID=1769908 RepID=A0A9P5BVN1_9PLEO|nr:Transcription initiation factor TFIID subunit 9 [Didymella heteroderae]
MASPAPDTNGISTPPATASAAHTNSPPASQPHPQSQPQPQSAAQPATTSTSASTAYPATSLLDTGATKRPRDARLIHLLLANMGVHAYTERVPLQLLDFAYRYTSGVLSDALAYEPPVPSSLAPSEKKKRDPTAEEGISLNALRTSVAGRAAMMTGAGGLGKEFLAEMASERNRVALPRVEREFGVRLPPERYCFTGVGWGVKEAWEGEEDDEDDESGGDGEGDEKMGDGGPVGAQTDAFGGPTAAGDTEMGGMDEEEVDEDEFREVMG